MRGEVARLAALAVGALLLLALPGAVGSAHAQAPGAPTLTATPGRFHVDLTWTTPTGTVTKFQYRWRRGSSTTFERWVDIPSSGSTTTSFRHSSLLSGFLHTYEVRAMNGSTPGAASNQASATPRPPTPTVTLHSSSDLGFSNTDGLTSDTSPTFTVSGLVAPVGAGSSTVTVTARQGTNTASGGASTRASSIDIDVGGFVYNGAWTVTATQSPDGPTASLPSAPVTVTMDVDKPKLTGAAYDVATKKLALTFDESVDASTLTPGEMHLRLREVSRFGQNLSGATATTTDGSSQTLTLTDAQAEAILQYKSLQLDADVDSSSVCTTPSSGQTASPACDLAGNVLEFSGGVNTDINVRVATPAAPAIPDLLTVSDTGEDTTDNLTAGTLDQGSVRGNYLILEASGFTDNALVTMTAVHERGATRTQEAASRDPLEREFTGLGDGKWTVTATQTTAGAVSPASPALVVTLDGRNASLSSASYNPVSNMLRLTYDETMNASTLELSRVTIRDTDGVPATVRLTGATAPTTDGATLDITLTNAQATTVERMGDPQLRIGNAAVDDMAGNVAYPQHANWDLPAGVPVTLAVSPNPVTEGASATVTASLASAITGATTVTVAAAGGTAESGDYTLSSNKTLTIASGQTSSSGTVTIAANQDTDTDNETVTVSATASNSSSGVTNPPNVTLRITDDDAIPGAPRNLSASAGESRVDLRWTRPSGTITGYDYSQDDGSTWTAMTGSNAGTTSFMVTGLTNGTRYFFRVRAKNSAGTGPASNSVRATPRAATSVPAAATLSASPGNTQVNLTWTAPSGQPIASWDVSQNNGTNWTAISGSGADTRRHTVTGLSNGTQYTFRVRAKNSRGNGAQSNAAQATPAAPAAVPGAPTLRATGGAGQVALSWTAPGGTITGWDYSQDNGATWTAVPGGGAGTTSHTVRGLMNGLQYTFRVRAKNAAGNGAPSNQARATPQAAPGAPTGLRATGGDASVELTWTPPAGSITGWDYSSDNGANWREVPGGGASTRSHLAMGLTNEVEYTFRVRAKNRAGVGPASNSAKATPSEATAPPGRPTGLTAEAGDRQAELTWTPTGSAAGRWEYSVDGGRTWTQVPGSGPGTTRHLVTGLANGREYSFHVRGWNLRGYGPPSNEARATPSTAALVPGAPPTLTAIPGDRQVTLHWTLPTGPSITEWLHTTDDGQSWHPIPGSGPLTTSFPVTGLTNGVEYAFRVRAVNSLGPGTPSDVVRATPGAVVPVPALPVGALVLLAAALLAGRARAVRRRRP